VVLDLVIIGLVIALLPLTIVAFMLILGARQGIWKGLAFIAGWMACLVAVIAVVVLVTGGKPPEPHTAPSTAALVVKAAAACSDPGRDWRESSSWMEQRPDSRYRYGAMTCTEAGATAVGGRMGSNRDCAFAKPQVSEVIARRRVSEVMFEFMPLSCASGRIGTCAHGSGGGCCSPA